MQNQRTNKARALLEFRTEIASDLIVDYVIDHLIETEVFTEEEKTQILCHGTNVGPVDDLSVRDDVLRMQSEYFVDLLLEKMQRKDFAFNNFIFILMKEGYYPWLGNKILKRVSQMNNEEEMLAQLNATPPFFLESNPGLCFAHSSGDSVVICNDVPNKVKNLLQRSDKLEEIRAKLIDFGVKGKGWVMISGMGGGGKSILAAEAVRDWNCEHYTDGIWWTNCGQMYKEDKQFDDSMLLIKMQLLWERITGLENIKFESLETAVIKLKNYFKKKPKSLIILDDVWNKEVLDNFEIGIPIMVTARDRSVLSYRIPNEERTNIEVMDNDYGLSVEESRQLLALWVRCAPKELNQEFVNKIIEKFKGNPLCLTLIGSFMEDNEQDWKALYESVSDEHTHSDHKSPRRRSSSGPSFVYNQLGFDILVRKSYDALSPDLRDYYKSFAIFLEDIRIPIEVFQVVWNKSRLIVSYIMNKLVEKSLVMTLKANEVTLYMVHDIILNFLKAQCLGECHILHSGLLENYFDNCLQSDGSYKYSSLPNDGYIYYFLGYHIYKSGRTDLFSEIFLDLSFVVNKIKYTGPSDLLNDYYNYKEHFLNKKDRYRDFVSFVSTNADLLCDLTIDVLQLALCQPNDSQVYKNALDLVSKSGRLYLKWCNQSNVKTSKLLSSKLHSGSVRYAVFDPKGKFIVSVGTDKVSRLWDSNTGKQLRILKGHHNTINCCQISADGKTLITASDDGTVKVWEIDYFNEINGNFDPYLCSPRPRSGTEYPHTFNGSMLLDESSHTYDCHTSDDNQIEVKCCAITPNSENLVASGGTDLLIHIWKLSNVNKPLQILSGHTYPVVSCQFSNDSQSNRLISASGDEVFIWNRINGTLIKKLKHEMYVQNCVFGGRVDYIFTSSGRYVYQWSSNRELPKTKFNNLKTKYYVTHCAVSPNGVYLAGGTTTDQVVIWSLKDYFKVYKAVATFKCADRINCINFNSESTKLLSCLDDGTVMIWDTSKTFGASMVALRKRFSIQNRKQDLKVLTPDENGTLRLFEGIEGKENRTLHKVSHIASHIELSLHSSHTESPTYDITCCALSYNCDILFGTSEGELILHLSSVTLTHNLESHGSEVTFCAFIDTQNKFVSASRDSTFRIYKRHSLTYNSPKYEDKSGGDDLPVLRVIDFGPIVDCKLFAKDLKCMVWSENGRLFLLDLNRNRLINSCAQSSRINSADITSNQELIATVAADKSVKLWRWTSSESHYTRGLFEIRSIAQESCPRSCRFAPDASFLVIGYDSGVIKIWNFTGTESSQQQQVHHFQSRHTDWVNDLCVSPNGNLIISASKSIKLWNRAGELLQTFKTNGGTMTSIYASFIDPSDPSRSPGQRNNEMNKIVTVDDAGVLYILQILNFNEFRV